MKYFIFAILFFPTLSYTQVIGDIQISGNNPYTINATVNSDEFSDPANYFCLLFDTDLSEFQFGTTIEPFVMGENSISDTVTVNPASSILYVQFLPLDTNGPCEYQTYGEQGGQEFDLTSLNPDPDGCVIDSTEFPSTSICNFVNDVSNEIDNHMLPVLAFSGGIMTWIILRKWIIGGTGLI